MPTPYAWNAPRQVSERQQVQMEAQGYYAENFPRGSMSNTTIMVSGTVYYLGVGLLAGDRVTNISAVCNVLGSTFSGINMKAGIYSKGGVLLASTGDISTAYSTTGVKSSALAPQSNGDPFYIIPASDGYYVALLAIATTPPTLFRSATGTFGAAFGSATLNQWGSQTGQTDLPANASMLTSGTGFWVGVS